MGWYRIKDILYQNNGKGEYMTSKVGEKYDRRRGKIVAIHPEDIKIDSPYVLNYIGEDGYIITTPVQSFKTYTDKGKATTFLSTLNSVYQLEEVEHDENAYEIINVVNKNPEDEAKGKGKYRLFRLVKIIQLEEGKDALLNYLDDGLNLKVEMMWSTKVLNIEHCGNGNIKFETENTFYTLRKL